MRRFKIAGARVRFVRLVLTTVVLISLAQLSQGQSFTYNDFSSLAGLTVNGSAAQSGNVLLFGSERG